MKKKATFYINAEIKPALKKMAKETGVTPDFFVNKTLEKALNEYFVFSKKQEHDLDPVQYTEDFAEWADTNLPLDTLFVKGELYNKYIKEVRDTERILITPKRFVIWIREYSLSKEHRFFQGKNQKGRWGFIRSLKE